jgi:hypothetical protein
VDEAVLVEQVASFGRERPAVVANHLADLVVDLTPAVPADKLLDRDHERRVADDPALSVDDPGQLR